MDFSGKPQGTRRATAIGAVIVFHILLLYALVSGLARKAIEVLPAPFETQILDEQRAEEEPPPPPPPPQLDIPPPPFVPPPEINIATPPPSSANTITTQSVVATPPARPMPAASPNTRRCPSAWAKPVRWYCNC